MTWLSKALVVSAVALFGAGAVADHCTKGTCEKGACAKETCEKGTCAKETCAKGADSCCKESGKCCKESGECSKESGECCKESGECSKESGECSKESGECSKESGECSKESASCCEKSGSCEKTEAVAKATECKGGECSHGTSVSLASTSKSHGCPIEAAMAKLPKMTYTVGDKTICCSKTAAKLAEESGAKVRYAVGKKTFDDKQKAFVTLVKTTEEFVDGFAAPHKCSVTGSTTVAGTKCHCPVEAEKRAKVVRAAMAKVRMTYLVGEKSCNCPVEAKKLAKDSGSATLYVVNSEKTGCDYTARLNLARAKYKAAVQAAEKLSASSDAPASSQSHS